MSACCPTCGAPAPPPVQAPRNSAPVGRPGPRTSTIAVLEPDFRPQLTMRRECDVSTALARGLAEYLGQQSIEVGGRRLSVSAYSTWAEPEQNAALPAIGVAPSSGTYERSISPLTLIEQVDHDLRLVAFTEFEQQLNVELWASDPKERAYLGAMIEEALNPVDWMYGLRLVLPYYHGTTATYELKSCQYLDNSDDSVNRYRKALYVVEATITVYRLLSIPDAQPVLRLDVG